MSGGTFSVSRRIWKHTAFKAEPFTEREAWMWMLGKARWKAGVERAGDYVVPLERGQLAAAVRYMADKWRWTAPRVQRFLKRLQKLEMICSETDTGVTVITICKYDDYQGGGQAADTEAIQDRYTSDTIKNKDEIQREDREEEVTSVTLRAPSPANDLSHCVSRYNAAANQAGWPSVQKLNPNRSKLLRARLKDCGGVEGWEVALLKAFTSDFCRGRTADPWHGFSFDWLVKAANFTKLMEGNYENRDTTRFNTGSNSLHRAARGRRSQAANRS